MLRAAVVSAALLLAPAAAASHVYMELHPGWATDIMQAGETQELTAYFQRSCVQVTDGGYLPVEVSLTGDPPPGYEFDFSQTTQLPAFACGAQGLAQSFEVPYRLTATRAAQGDAEAALQVIAVVPADSPLSAALDAEPHTAAGITTVETAIAVEDAWLRGPEGPVLASEDRFTEFQVTIGVRSNAIALVQLVVVDSAGALWDLGGVHSLPASSLDQEETREVTVSVWAVNGGAADVATIGMEVRSWPGDPPYAYAEMEVAFEPAADDQEESAGGALVPLVAIAAALCARRLL